MCDDTTDLNHGDSTANCPVAANGGASDRSECISSGETRTDGAPTSYGGARSESDVSEQPSAKRIKLEITPSEGTRDETQDASASSEERTPQVFTVLEERQVFPVGTAGHRAHTELDMPQISSPEEPRGQQQAKKPPTQSDNAGSNYSVSHARPSPLEKQPVSQRGPEKSTVQFVAATPSPGTSLRPFSDVETNLLAVDKIRRNVDEIADMDRERMKQKCHDANLVTAAREFREVLAAKLLCKIYSTPKENLLTALRHLDDRAARLAEEARGHCQQAIELTNTSAYNDGVGRTQNEKHREISSKYVKLTKIAAALRKEEAGNL
ncbi:unnamed protein product [Amoebophrya sp. A120]|nr:unnamed protein product [Amoebophrya sp. A120]|eukprot:GSA120T00005685001.1